MGLLNFFLGPSQKIPIYINCPACIDDGYYTPKSYWVHAACNQGRLYLTPEADVYCSGCSHKNHITNWAFSCNSGRHDFRVPSTAGFAAAISTSSQMVNSAGQRWLIHALQKI